VTEEEQPDRRPKWSVTWLFRVQRVGREKPRPISGDGGGAGFKGWFPWAVLLMLGLEIGVLVWLGIIPR